MTINLKTWAAAGALVLAAGVAGAAGVPGQGTWETTLQPRDLDGDTVIDAFYDTELDITWLRNANVNGRMNWYEANAWAANLVVGAYSDWRLPKMIDTGNPGCDFWSYGGGNDCGYNPQTKSGDTVFNEMAHLFAVTLGNKSLCTPEPEAGNPNNCLVQTGWGLTNTGDFQGVQQGYWTGRTYWDNTTRYPEYAWIFSTEVLAQTFDGKDEEIYAMAVRGGTVLPQAPEPGAAAMVLLGLGALALARRRAT